MQAQSLKKRSNGAPIDEDSSGGVPASPRKSNPDVLLSNRSEWLLVQSRYLRIYKRRFVVVERDKITAHDTETDLSKPVYSLSCQEILEVNAAPEDPLVVVVKLRGEIIYRFKFAMKERSEDWIAAVAMRALKKSK